MRSQKEISQGRAWSSHLKEKLQTQARNVRQARKNTVRQLANRLESYRRES